MAPGLYAFQAAATAESAVGAWTSTSAMAELPSGGARMVAGPRTATLQPAGAMKVLPMTVALGVLRTSCSAPSAAGATPEGGVVPQASDSSATGKAARVNTARRFMAAPPGGTQ